MYYYRNVYCDSDNEQFYDEFSKKPDQDSYEKEDCKKETQKEYCYWPKPEKDCKCWPPKPDHKEKRDSCVVINIFADCEKKWKPKEEHEEKKVKPKDDKQCINIFCDKSYPY